MSVGSQLLNAGWSVLLNHHETLVRHTPANGGPVRELQALDNGQPEAVAALALAVDGLSRIVTITRSAATVLSGDSITIGLTTYRVLQVRQRNEQATELMLGATVIAGKQ